jgi:hypothetical protein
MSAVLLPRSGGLRVALLGSTAYPRRDTVKTLHQHLVGAPILGAELVCVLSARHGPAFEYREGVPLCASDDVRQLVPLGIRPALIQPRFATRPVASGREPLFVHAAPFKARAPWRETGAAVRQSKATNLPRGANGCASSQCPSPTWWQGRARHGEPRAGRATTTRPSTSAGLQSFVPAESPMLPKSYHVTTVASGHPL